MFPLTFPPTLPLLHTRLTPLPSIHGQVTQFSGEPTQLVRLRSSLGHTGEYVGRWARGSLEWDEVSALERERLGPHTLADGEFW